MTETRCEMSDLPPEMCAHCQGADAEPTPELVILRETTARFDGRCEVCGEWTIREGDPLYATREAPGTIVVWAGRCCVGDRP